MGGINLVLSEKRMVKIDLAESAKIVNAFCLEFL